MPSKSQKRHERRRKQRAKKRAEKRCEEGEIESLYAGAEEQSLVVKCHLPSPYGEAHFHTTHYFKGVNLGANRFLVSLGDAESLQSSYQRLAMIRKAEVVIKRLDERFAEITITYRQSPSPQKRD